MVTIDNPAFTDQYEIRYRVEVTNKRTGKMQSYSSCTPGKMMSQDSERYLKRDPWQFSDAFTIKPDDHSVTFSIFYHNMENNMVVVEDDKPILKDGLDDKQEYGRRREALLVHVDKMMNGPVPTIPVEGGGVKLAPGAWETLKLLEEVKAFLEWRD